MLENEDMIMQYTLYEKDMMTDLGSGFSTTADTPKGVMNNLEGESFTVKYYVLTGPQGTFEIRSKQALVQWYKDVTNES